MSDLYTDVERSIVKTLQTYLAAKALVYPVFSNQVTKKDYKNYHASIDIMRISDVFAPHNGGGTGAYLRTANFADGTDTDGSDGFGVDGFGSHPFGEGNVMSYNKTDWPDPWELTYSFTVSTESAKGAAQTGLQHVRTLDQALRQAFRPRRPMVLWDSSLNNGAGGWTDQYANYVWAGYINRDIPDEEMYSRVSNIRFEVFSYTGVTVVEPAITSVPTLDIEIGSGD